MVESAGGIVHRCNARALGRAQLHRMTPLAHHLAHSITRGRTTLLTLTLAAVAAAGFTACGGTAASSDRERGRSRPAPRQSVRHAQPRDDRAVARRALIRVGDLPAGWSAESPVRTVARCSARALRATTALESSARMHLNYTDIQEDLGLYATPRGSASAFRRLNSRQSEACLRNAMYHRIRARQRGARVAPLSVVRVDRPEAWTRSVRLTTTVTTRTVDAGYIDVVRIRKGRALALLLLISSPSPLDEQSYAAVNDLMNQRIDKSLN